MRAESAARCAVWSGDFRAHELREESSAVDRSSLGFDLNTASACAEAFGPQCFEAFAKFGVSGRATEYLGAKLSDAGFEIGCHLEGSR